MRFLLESSLIVLLSASCAPVPLEINHNTIDAITAAVSHPDRIESDRERDTMAGGGYYTGILSRTVGADGQVYCRNTARLLGNRFAHDIPVRLSLLEII